MLERRSLLPGGLALACRVTAGRQSSRAQAQSSRPARTFPVRDRGGFTLFEMLLVLVLISIAMALAWPALGRLSTRQQLIQSGELARIRLLSTRVHAIEQGLPYQFRFEPGGQRYCILPGDSSAEPAVDTGGGTVVLPVASGKLPGRITFDDLEMGTTGGGMIPQPRFAALPEARDLAIVNWSPPIVFQADGTGPDQTITLSDPQESRSVVIALRGLTGGVIVSDKP